MVNVVLGLDVSSTRTGFAIVKNGKWIRSKGNFGNIVIPKAGTLAEKLCYFRDTLSEIIDTIKPTHIIIEDIFSNNNIKTLKLLARFSGVAIELCRRKLGADPFLVSTMAVRSFLKCGKKKEEAFKFICTKLKLDWDFDDMNDIADAIALALYQDKNLRSSNEST